MGETRSSSSVVENFFALAPIASANTELREATDIEEEEEKGSYRMDIISLTISSISLGCKLSHNPSVPIELLS